MPVPERTFKQEFFDVKPPVIPVKFIIPKGKGKPSTVSTKGFEGFKLQNFDGTFKCIKTLNFTLKVLGDGYAEIPKTEHNIAKLELLSKDRHSKPTYDRGVWPDENDPEKMWFRNNKDVPTLLTDKSLEDGDIRMISRGFPIKASVKSLKKVREFDVTNPRTKDADLAQKVRPWLKDFVKVDAAIMEAAAI